MTEQVKEKPESQARTALLAREGTGPTPASAFREPQRASTREELVQKSAEYLETVSGGKRLDKEDKDQIIKHTLENFDDYFNRGFLHYRKSVAEA